MTNLSDWTRAAVYAFVALVINCFYVTVLEIAARTKTSTFTAQEDIETFHKNEKPKPQLKTTIPEAMTRVSNLHRNATENFVAFALSVLAYHYGASLGPSTSDHTACVYLMAIYALSRWIYTLCYQFAIQPWRTISFTVGWLIYLVIALMGLKMAL